MNWITGSIRNKLLAVFGLGLFVVVASALYGFGASRNGLKAMERINGTMVAQANEVKEMETLFREQVQEWENVLLRGNDPDALERYWGRFLKHEQGIRESTRRLQQAIDLPKAKDLLARFAAAHDAMGVKYREGLETFKAADYEPRSGDSMVRGIEVEPTALLEEVVRLMRAEANGALGGAQKKAYDSLYASLAIMGAATLAAILTCGWLLVRVVVRPIREAVCIADAVADGDLAIEIESSAGDEAGRLLAALGRMCNGLSEEVGTIRQAAQNVESGSKQIAEGNADLSSRTDEQASSLEETASSMEELTATVKQNTESAKRAHELAIGASNVASQGGRAIGAVSTTMAGIAEASRKIADILGVIDAIAFQTNILALNAAVEAARAGEQGRGFAVVASEVRSLAQRSATAAKEIKALIQSSAEKVDGGTKLVEDASRTMEEIVSSVKHVTEIVAEIAAASREQLSGIEQVGLAVTQMDGVTQQNAALVEESAAAAENMERQAEHLLRAVMRFKLEGADRAALPLTNSSAPPDTAPPARLSGESAAGLLLR